MSTTAPSSSFGGTLAGGIQDVSAILPLIGTEQCDKHVGSALTGGYLYAAAAPLSIFGSLGIVKAGISILISSISISIPHISISFRDSKPSVRYLGKKKTLGGKLLRDAGFELTGTVAPLIGMDGHRFKAETRLINMLEEKHIDDHEKISLSWKSRQWNIMLVLATILAAAISIAPYIALILGPTSWRPKHVHLRWMYPIFRVAGSCFTTVTTQLIIQSRVISLMKNRIVFMVMGRRVEAEYKEQLDAWLKHSKIEWDPNLPAEHCIWSLEQYLLSSNSSVQFKEDPEDRNHAPAQKDNASTTDGASPSHHSILITPPRSLLTDLYQLQQEYFPSPTRDAAFALFLWVVLAISLPATVAGYIGCFTLIGATSSTGNGPLVWVGLEAALSILRIFVWASNPKFDEETEVTVKLKLSKHQPMVTTNDYNPSITDSDDDARKPFTLVPEDVFLARITPFTGPLNQFQKSPNVTLYFTLTAKNKNTQESIQDDVTSTTLKSYMRLFMTVVDFNMKLGVTFESSERAFHYYDAPVKYNTASRTLEARIESERSLTHPWRTEDDHLFNSLQLYYHYLASAIKQRDVNTDTAILLWKWDLSPQPQLTNPKDNNMAHLSLPSITPGEQLYLDRGYEYHLKSELIETWGRWIVTDMRNIRAHTRSSCHEALKDEASEKAKWELTELDVQLMWEWVKRELAIVMLSFELEEILLVKMKACVSEVTRARGEGQLEAWMWSESDIALRNRLEQEREAAKRRMRKAMEEASWHADEEKRSAQRYQWQFFPQWDSAHHFIDWQWSARLTGQLSLLKPPEVELDGLIMQSEGRRQHHKDRVDFVKRLKGHISHEHWRPQHQIEEEIMKSTIERARLLPVNSTRDQLDKAYYYPDPDTQATKKFVKLGFSSSKGKACSAQVYDARTCHKDAVRDVIAKITTRSVLNMDPEIVPFIPPNEHLLFLSCEDGKGVDLPFIQQNRDMWWSQQTTNSSTIYFTPKHIWNDNSCFCNETQVTAHILIFLAVSSTVHVHVIHRGEATNVSLLENGEELGCLSAIPKQYQLHEFQSFTLRPGAHELELIPQVDSSTPDRKSYAYYLRDIFIELSDNPNDNPASGETGPGVLVITEDDAPAQGLCLMKENTSTIDVTGT